jgi:hypothetical protein
MTEQSQAPEVPSFNLDATNLDITTDEALQEAIEKEQRKGFDPGRYTLRLSKPRFHANKDTKSIFCKNDPTWFNVVVTLESADGRSKDYFIQVPTTKVKYTGGKGKDTLFVFGKFCEFMAAIGEAVSLQNLSKIVPKYFASEETLKKLDGKEIDVDMAHEGAYAEKVDDLFKIVLKTGDYQEDGETVMFPDFNSAKTFAAAKNIELSFVEVKKLHSKVKPAEKKEGWTDTVPAAPATAEAAPAPAPEPAKGKPKKTAKGEKKEGWGE